MPHCSLRPWGLHSPPQSGRPTILLSTKTTRKGKPYCTRSAQLRCGVLASRPVANKGSGSDEEQGPLATEAPNSVFSEEFFVVDIPRASQEPFKGPDADSLCQAAKEGQLDRVKELIGKKVDVNGCDRTGHHPLFLAAEAGHTAVVQALTEGGADVNKLTAHHATALWAAVHKGHVGIVKMLLDSKADPNVYMVAKALLSTAVIKGNMELVQLLLEHDANPNITVPGRNYPLVYAARNGRLDLVQVLIKAGADVDVVDEDGLTPLDHALEHDHFRAPHPQVVQALRDAKAAKDALCDVNATTKSREEVAGGHASCVSLPPALEVLESASLPPMTAMEQELVRGWQAVSIPGLEPTSPWVEDLLTRRLLNMQAELQSVRRENETLRRQLQQQDQQQDQHNQLPAQQQQQLHD